MECGNRHFLIVRQAELRGVPHVSLTRSLRKILALVRGGVAILGMNSLPSWRTATLLARELRVVPMHNELLAVHSASPAREPRKELVAQIDRRLFGPEELIIAVCGAGYAERLGRTYLDLHAVTQLPTATSFQLKSPGSAFLFSYSALRMYRRALRQIRCGRTRVLPHPFAIEHVLV